MTQLCHNSVEPTEDICQQRIWLCFNKISFIKIWPEGHDWPSPTQRISQMKTERETEPSYHVSSFLLSFPTLQTPTLWPFTATFSGYSAILTLPGTSVWLLCPQPFEPLPSVCPTTSLPSLSSLQLRAIWTASPHGKPPPSSQQSLQSSTNNVLFPPTELKGITQGFIRKFWWMCLIVCESICFNYDGVPGMRPLSHQKIPANGAKCINHLLQIPNKRQYRTVVSEERTSEVSPTIFCCRLFLDSCPGTENSSRAQWPHWVWAHDGVLGGGGSCNWQDRVLERKEQRRERALDVHAEFPSRRWLNIKLHIREAKEGHDKDQDKDQLLGISKLNNCHSSHNAEDIWISNSQSKKTLVRGSWGARGGKDTGRIQ